MNPLRGEAELTGPVNVRDFGTVQDSAETRTLFEMDAYLKVRDGTRYPSTLATAGMNDRRVIAWGPAKFAARLTATNASDSPVLLRVDCASGHGLGDRKSTWFERRAEMLAFGPAGPGIPV